MGIWRMDRKTAIYIAEHIWQLKEGFPLEHCEKCDSDYIKEVGHKHNDYIDFETQEVTEDDKIEPLKIMPPIYEQEREAVWDDVMSFVNRKE